MTTINVNVINGKARCDVASPQRPSSEPCARKFPLDDIPPHLCAKHYDVMVAYAPHSVDDVSKLRYILEQCVILSHSAAPTVYMYCCDVTPNFDLLQSMLERVSTVFLYATHAEFGDTFANHKKDEIITRCLLNPACRLVPILPNRACSAPNGMKSLKGLYVDKLLKGRDFSDVTVKELEHSGTAALESVEVTALKRLFDNGLAFKRQRVAKQQQDLKAWIREKLRNNQLRIVKQQQATSGAKQSEQTGDSCVGLSNNSRCSKSDSSICCSDSCTVVIDTASGRGRHAVEQGGHVTSSGPTSGSRHGGCQEAMENDENAERERLMSTPHTH